MKVEGRRVLVTGASGGLGREIALAFHVAGAELVLTGRREDALGEVAAATGGSVIVADLASDDGVQSVFDRSGPIDILVANAGLGGTGPITDFDPDHLDQVLEVNLRTPIRMSRHYGREMVERGGGHISLISSMAGKVTGPGSSVYSATKFGLRGFGLAVRQDLAPHGVGVSVVMPGFIRDAGMFADNDVELPSFIGTNSPEEVGAAVLRGVERNQSEVTIAPVLVKGTANLANLAPRVAAWVAGRAPVDLD